jgi:hypothetical protein
MSGRASGVGQMETALNGPLGGVVGNDSARLDAMAGAVGRVEDSSMLGTSFGLAQIGLEGRHGHDVRWCTV